MSRHRDGVYLAHMRDHAQTVVEIVAGKTLEELKTQPTLRYAVLHLLCIIGEAASKVSDRGREQYAEVPWRLIVGTRNRLIHGYDEVDLELIWETTQLDLPALIQTLNGILEP